MRSRRAWGSRQYFSLRCRIARSGACSTRRNGPVPIAAPSGCRRRRSRCARPSGATGRSGADRGAGSGARVRTWRRCRRRPAPTPRGTRTLRGCSRTPEASTSVASRMERSSDALALAAVSGEPSEKVTSRLQVEPHGPRLVLERPALAQQRREVASGVRRDQRLEDVGEQLVLLGGLVRDRLARRDRVRHRDDERPAGGDLGLGGLLGRREPLDLRLVLGDARVLAPHVRDRGREGEEAHEVLGISLRAGRRDARARATCAPRRRGATATRPRPRCTSRPPPCAAASRPRRSAPRPRPRAARRPRCRSSDVPARAASGPRPRGRGRRSTPRPRGTRASPSRRGPSRRG